MTFSLPSTSFFLKLPSASSSLLSQTHQLEIMYRICSGKHIRVNPLVEAIVSAQRTGQTHIYRSGPSKQKAQQIINLVNELNNYPYFSVLKDCFLIERRKPAVPMDKTHSEESRESTNSPHTRR